jgi:hypothetical protein
MTAASQYENLPAVIPERVHYAEITEDRPKSLWELELEEKKIYNLSEEGVRERYPGRNQRLKYNEFSERTEYDQVSKFLIEKQELIKRGWTSGAIEKLLGKPNFVVPHRDFLPWHLWFKSDATYLEGSPKFIGTLDRSIKAKELKIRADETKLTKLKEHLAKTKIKAPSIPFRQLINDVCETENRRRSRKRNEYAEWECHLNIHSDTDALYELARKFLHKKMDLISGQILSLFGAKGIREAQSEMYKVIDLEIRKSLNSYSAFAHFYQVMENSARKLDSFDFVDQNRGEVAVIR